MKKVVLFLLVAVLVITTACERDYVFEPVHPAAGTWDELVAVQLQRLDGEDTSSVIRHLRWDQMLILHAEELSDRYTVNLNNLQLITKEINFERTSDLTGIMQITTRYLGEIGENGANLCYDTEIFETNGVIVSKEFIEIQYEINEEIGKILVSSGRYTGSTFGSSAPNSECSPTGDITNIHFEFAFPDSERNRESQGRGEPYVDMNLIQIGDVVNPDDPTGIITGIQSTHFLQRRP